jgi:hypothetical protein
MCFYYSYDPFEIFTQRNLTMVVGFATNVQSVHITTNVVSSNPAHGEVFSIQHYVI